MSDWSWKQAVAESVLRLVNEKASPSFSIDEIYAQVPEFSALFPRNQHVKEKLRQTLQRLRDDGFLSFVGGGNYQLKC
jgi:type II restriction enzyme